MRSSPGRRFRRPRRGRLSLPHWRPSKDAGNVFGTAAPWKPLIRLFKGVCLLGGSALAGATFWYGYDGYLDNKCMAAMQDWNNILALLDHCAQNEEERSDACKKLDRGTLPERPSCISRSMGAYTTSKPTMPLNSNAEPGLVHTATSNVSKVRDSPSDETRMTTASETIQQTTFEDPLKVPTRTSQPASSLLATEADTSPYPGSVTTSPGIPLTTYWQTSQPASSLLATGADTSLYPGSVTTSPSMPLTTYWQTSIGYATTAMDLMTDQKPLGAYVATTVANPVFTQLPKMITMPYNLATAPEDSVLIHLAFTAALNYEFLVDEPKALGQLPDLLSALLSYDGVVSSSDIVLCWITPLQTQDRVGYITAMAHVYYPARHASQLQLDLANPFSALYTQRQYGQQILALADLIDLDLSFVDATSYSDAVGAVHASWKADERVLSDIQQSLAIDHAGRDQVAVDELQSAYTTDSVVIGALTTILLYGLAMLSLARQYKKRRAFTSTNVKI